MKLFIAFAALVAVAVSTPLLKPTVNDYEVLEAIVAAINSPNTDPATAALLEQQLQDIIVAAIPVQVGPAIVQPVEYEPISVGPATVEESVYEPISVGPAIVDFPLVDGGVVTAPVPVAPSPVVIGPIAPGSPSPLVQIIVNIINADSTIPPVVGAITPEPIVKPDPVSIVESPMEPVQVVEIAPAPVQVVETAPAPVQVVETAPTPVQVVETAPVVVEPVIIGTPIIPAPAVVLPEELN